jgi:4-alpha-glucanotransferase
VSDLPSLEFIEPSNLLNRRRAGVLLHPTSLPGHYENGDLGHDAYRFVDLLASAGVSVWQMLPLGPTHEDRSPYACLSVHAGNPRLISLSWLADRGLLHGKEVQHECDKRDALDEAFVRFKEKIHGNDSEWHQTYAHFVAEEANWLDDYALFIVIRAKHNGAHWLDWPPALRDRRASSLNEISALYARELERVRFEQFIFFAQWHQLREYAAKQGVYLFGDMPIFVAHDSAEVWAHREYFKLNDEGQPFTVAGVPPDYFSATGQRWGNPHYDWDAMRADNFAWWKQRLHTQLELFDLVRVDHFRGFESCWHIPADEETAINGYWVATPGRELLTELGKQFDHLPLVAEDLGIITPEVEALRDDFELPGMRILQFAFGDTADNLYLPHNHIANAIAYTGTHDNDTTVGWYTALDEAQRQHVMDYLGPSYDAMPWPLIRSMLSSVAVLGVVPMQDLLALDTSARMNTPGTVDGNWQWRFTWDQIPSDLAARLCKLIELYGRLDTKPPE